MNSTATDFSTFDHNLPEMLGRMIFNLEYPELTEEQYTAAIPSIGAFLYYHYRDKLPERHRETCAAIFSSQSMVELGLEVRRREVESICTNAGMRFMWLKGADIAFSSYPHPVLRLTGDLDILIHPDHCARARQVFLDHGWSNNGFSFTGRHHFEPLFKGKVMLEPHFNLPYFGAVSPPEVWKECPEDRLTPEMNLVMLMQHATAQKWTRISVYRLLMDFAFVLLKHKVNWAQIDQLVNRWQLLHPALLIAAFPEFFPMPSPLNVPGEIAGDLRSVFSENHRFCRNTDLLEVLSENNFLKLSWWQLRLKAFAPDRIRFKYHIPRGKPFGLLNAYFRDLMHKTFWPIKKCYSQKDMALADYLKRVDRINRWKRNC